MLLRGDDQAATAARLCGRSRFGAAKARAAGDQVSFSPVSAWCASRMVIIRVIGSTGDG